MKIALEYISKQEKHQLLEMLLPYFKEIDSSKIIQTEFGESIDYPYLDSYWIDTNRIPLKIMYNQFWIGFILVNDWTISKGFNAEKSIAEFYITPLYRRKGIGKNVAFKMFDKYKTKWEVRQSSTNVTATKFWRNTIGEYVNGKFKELFVKQEDDTIVIQLFES